MSVFSVDPSALKTASTKLKSASADYERIYKQLIQTATSMGAAYESEDNKKFVTQIEGCCAALQAMADRLALTAQQLSKASDNYTSTEEHNASQASQL